MIELITGSPGAGKTTFAVASRIASEAKRVIALDAETCVRLQVEPGTTVTRRIVVAGVRGLLVEHDRLPHILTRDATSPAEVERWNAMVTERGEDGKPLQSDAPVHQRLPGEAPQDVPCLMQNWWLWCRPGDLIVIDEAQFVMPRGTLGRKPPYWLQAMEIHRHYGVDFLLITQHPQLIDTTVRALVGLHRHVRAVMGSPVCMVYVWDHASNPERYTTANKTTFIRRAAHYALFHSAAAHVKPPSAGRWGLVAAPLLLVVGLGGLAWKVSAFGGKADASPGAAVVAPGSEAAPAASPVRQHRQPAGFIDVPKLSGCYAWGERCECIDAEGRRVLIGRSMCVESSRGFNGLVAWERQRVQVPYGSPASGDDASSSVRAASAADRGGGSALPAGGLVIGAAGMGAAASTQGAQR